ncbi:MAG: type II secretory pathway component GspD/PulD (secretin) [Verrucomicrobiales bacterium]|jgi:type II secretory pathway component GspD/PulD (secretin)
MKIQALTFAISTGVLYWAGSANTPDSTSESIPTKPLTPVAHLNSPSGFNEPPPGEFKIAREEIEQIGGQRSLGAAILKFNTQIGRDTNPAPLASVVVPEFRGPDPTPQLLSYEDAEVAAGTITIGQENLPVEGDVETGIFDEEEGAWVRGAELNEVFQYLAQLGGYQFFHNSTLAGPTFLVTGQLKDGDPLAQMEELGLMYGITVYTKGSTVYALNEAQLAMLPKRPMQYNLKYLRPNDIEQIKTILQPVLTPGSGTVDYESKTNTLIVYDTEQRLEGVMEILEEMDRPKQQIAIETKILRVKSSSSNRIGVDWSSVLGDGISLEASSTLNTLFNLPDADTVNQVVTLTKDASRAIEALSGSGITGTPSDDGGATLSNGLSSTLLNGAISQSASSAAAAIDPLTGNLTSSLFGGSQGSTSGSNLSRNFSSTRSTTHNESALVLSPTRIQAVIRALSAGNLAQQESSPTLITEDNEEGIISIIDRIPIISSTISETDFGQNISEEVRYRVDTDDPVGDPTTSREIGVTVSITPTILPDETIRMILRPRTAQIVEFVRGQSGNLYPRVNESMIQTIARVPDGHSLLIGGVYEVTESDISNKVPLLGDIPGLNMMFKSSERGKEHTSLVFIVTPTSYNPVSIPETDFTTRRLNDLHVVPKSHKSPDRKNPGSNHESNFFNNLGNMFNLKEDSPSDNQLDNTHPMHSMQIDDGTYNQLLRSRKSPVSESEAKRRGLFGQPR